MQIKKIVEGIIGSVENKIEDSSKSSESKTKAFQGGISTAPKDLFEESQIKEAEKRHEKERDAAWMAFGTSMVAAGATAGMGAAAGIGSSAASIGSAAAAAGGAAATGISSAANEAIASKKGAPQEAETKKAALADKTISEILSAKLTATQAATQAAVVRCNRWRCCDWNSGISSYRRWVPPARPEPVRELQQEQQQVEELPQEQRDAVAGIAAGTAAKDVAIAVGTVPVAMGIAAVMCSECWISGKSSCRHGVERGKRT